MCAPARFRPGCGRAKREPVDAEPRGWRWPGTVEAGASRVPPAPAPSKRPVRWKDDRECRRRRSPPLRSGRRMPRARARAGRPELAQRRGFGSSEEFLHFPALIDDTELRQGREQVRRRPRARDRDRQQLPVAHAEHSLHHVCRNGCPTLKGALAGKRLLLGVPPAVGEMRLPQIELPLDPAPRLVFQLTAAKELVDLLSLGLDQLELDLVVNPGELALPLVTLGSMLEVLETLTVAGSERVNDLLNQGTLGCELLEPLDRGFDRLPPGIMLLGPVALALAAARMGKAERANHERQHQALRDQGDEDDGKRQEKNQVARGKWVPVGSRKRDGEGCC